MMRGILIDPFTKSVREVATTGELLDIYSHIKADCFCIVSLTDDGETLYLDDEGLFRHNQEFFALGSFPNPLAGIGLILGSNSEGEATATAIDVEQVRRIVRWLDAAQAIEMNNTQAMAVMMDAADMNAEHAKDPDNTPFVATNTPMMDLDPETGKARA